MFVPAIWFLPLALSNSVASLTLTWYLKIVFTYLGSKPGTTVFTTWYLNLVSGDCVHIPGISDTLNCFSSKRFIILSGIFLYCFDKQTFPKLLVSLPHRYTFPPHTLKRVSHFDLQLVSELEQFLFCYFILFPSFLFVCCTRSVACKLCSYSTTLHSIRFPSFYL